MTEDNNRKSETVCGFVSLSGTPNVGKSTLLNRLLGEDLAIISPKPQTTWRVVRGILTAPEGQIIFVDTPGIHHSRDSLGRYMVSSAREAIFDADLNLWMTDCRREPLTAEENFRSNLPDTIPAFLIINKVDLIPRVQLLPLIDRYRELYPFKEIIPISALKGENTDRLLSAIWKHLPPGTPLFPDDQLSDRPEREIVQEFIREKVFILTHEEIPYSTAVTIESWEERGEGKKILISALITVERTSQKKILIGKKGAMIKKIGTEARKRIESFIGVPVFLDLHVRVREKWRRKRSTLRDLGFGI